MGDCEGAEAVLAGSQAAVWRPENPRQNTVVDPADTVPNVRAADQGQTVPVRAAGPVPDRRAGRVPCQRSVVCRAKMPLPAAATACVSSDGVGEIHDAAADAEPPSHVPAGPQTQLAAGVIEVEGLDVQPAAQLCRAVRSGAKVAAARRQEAIGQQHFAEARRQPIAGLEARRDREVQRSASAPKPWCYCR